MHCIKVCWVLKVIKDPGREYHSVDKKVALPPSATSLYCIWQQIKAGMKREKKTKPQAKTTFSDSLVSSMLTFFLDFRCPMMMMTIIYKKRYRPIKVQKGRCSLWRPEAMLRVLCASSFPLHWFFWVITFLIYVEWSEYE